MSLSLNLGFVGNPESSLLVTSGPDRRSFDIKTNKIDLKQPLGIVLKMNDGFLLKAVTH